MKNHTIRCLKTLSCLPRYPGRITTPEIHRRLRDEGFTVSLRTLQRDLESLSGSFPIGSEHQGRSLAWYWAGKATLFSIPAMDAYTALTFLLAEANMQTLFPAGIRASMKPYFDAPRDVLVKQDRRHLKNWKEKIRFVARGQPLKPAPVRPEVVRAVHEALLQDKRLLARYRKREEARGKERELPGVYFRGLHRRLAPAVAPVQLSQAAGEARHQAGRFRLGKIPVGGTGLAIPLGRGDTPGRPV